MKTLKTARGGKAAATARKALPAAGPGLREARRVSARRADGVAEVVAPARHSVTEVLAAHAAALDLGALPARVRATAALLVLDTVGCALGALALEDGRRLAAAVAAFGDAGPVTLWGRPGTAGPAAAAFVHGNLANFLDADETFRNFSHFCAGVVPAVLAAAEERNATGAQVVVATVAGYEVAARLALAIPNLTARPRGEAVEIGWSDGGGHSWLALAAAVGAGRIYNLDGEGLARAMGLAAFLAPLPTFGRWWHSFPMRMTKYMLYGATAQAGVLAARMAEDGVTGDGAILDGDGALWRMVGGVKFEAAPLLSPPGDPWWIDQAAFKLYPCSRLLHGALDGVAQVLGAARRAGFGWRDVAELEIGVQSAVLTHHYQNRAPAEAASACFSLPYVAALLCLEVPPGPDWLAPETLGRADVREMMARIRCVEEPRATRLVAEQLAEPGRAGFELGLATVRLMAGGRRFEAEVGAIAGDQWVEKMRLLPERIEAKFRRFAAAVLPAAAVEDVIAACRELEGLARVRPALKTLGQR